MESADLNTTQLIATCPACGLLCDDALIENRLNTLTVKAKGCAKSVAFFEQAQSQSEVSAKIAGKPATLQAAILKAVQILKLSKTPLFSGLGTDVLGFRALFNLVQITNATLQHMNATSLQRNMRVLQSAGWQTTTLTEVKNRADVIVCIGTDVVSHNPRFFERFVWVQNAMFCDAHAREIIYIGSQDLEVSAGVSPTGKTAQHIVCKTEQLTEITTVLRALVFGKTVKAAQVAGVAMADLQAVADKLKQAKYAVFTWVAKDLNFPHAELTIQNITETVAILNNSTRAAGLALGGSDGDTSANYTNTWLSGLALNDNPIEHDAVLWVNSFSPTKMPPPLSKPHDKKPTIALAHANSQFETEPDVFIPIATPGLDCTGTLFRVDSTVALPLKKLRDHKLPTLSEVVQQIEANLS